MKTRAETEAEEAEEHYRKAWEEEDGHDSRSLRDLEDLNEED